MSPSAPATRPGGGRISGPATADSSAHPTMTATIEASWMSLSRIATALPRAPGLAAEDAAKPLLDLEERLVVGIAGIGQVDRLVVRDDRGPLREHHDPGPELD